MAFLRSLLILVLLLSGCTLGQQHIRSLTILHLNDLHARLLPDSEHLGGFAHVATAIQKEKAKSEATLVLHGGDFVQGTPVSSIFEGLPVYEVANHLGIDVNTLGNHEFDYGWQKIPQFLETAQFPTVSANVVDGEGRLLTNQAYLIREVNGIRVAVIGALTADLPKLSRVDRRGPWQALPVAETVRRYARELYDRSDLIVVLCHIFDYEEDDILRDVPEVPLIVSGHNHGGQQEVKEIDGRICVKVRAYGRQLGRLDLRVDVPNKRIASYRWKRIPIDARRYPPDENAAKLIEQWEQKVSEVVDIPIGESKRKIGSRELQPVIESAMAEAVGAELAYMNRGGIRDSLPEGRILARHVWNILPFGNAIMSGRVQGKDLPEELQEGRQIDPEREYIVATNDFIAEKWREQGLLLPQEGPLVRDVLIHWVKTKKVIE